MAHRKKPGLSNNGQSDNKLKILRETGKVFCDASFLIAYLRNKEGKRHERAVEIMNYCWEENVTLYTTHEVIFETVTILRYQDGYHKAKEFLEEIEPTLEVFFPPQDCINQTKSLFLQLAKDKKLSLCDILSYVIVRNILGLKTPSLSFDGDFKSLGLLVID